MKKMRITVNGKAYEVDVEILQDDDAIETQPAFAPPARHAAPARMPAPAAAEPKKSKTAPASKSKNVTSPINGVVIEIPIKIGQTVKENDILIVVEAMKMRANITSPQKGTVATIDVKPGDKVESGQVVVTFE